MFLRKRILFILLIVIVIFTALNYGSHRFIVFPSFVLLERGEAKKDTLRCVQAIQREVHHLGLLCGDWAGWDDTYEFVVDKNSEYIKSNLGDASFTDNRLNLIYIINNKGGVVWGKIMDLEEEETIQMQDFPVDFFPEKHPLIAFKTDGIPLKDVRNYGIFMTNKGPMLIASRPILTSENNGPSRGALIMGRFLNEAVITTLKEQTQVDFQLWPIQDESIPGQDSILIKQLTKDKPLLIHESNEKLLNVYTRLSDIQGIPILLLKADITRDITAEGRTAMQYAMISTVFVGVMILLVLLFLLQKTVVGPITELTKHTIDIGKSNDLSARICIKRNDEIGILAKEFDHTVEKLAETQKLFEAVITQAPIPMAVATPEGVLKIFNDACAQHLGFEDNSEVKPGASLLGLKKSWQEYDCDGNIVPPDKLPLVLATQGKITKGLELRIVRYDGSERWEIVNAAPIYDDNGEIIAGFAAFPDITERKRAGEIIKDSEEKHRKLIETAYDAIFITDIETEKIIDINKKAEKLLGLPAEKIIGMHYTELYPKEESELYSKRFQIAIQKEEDIITNAFVVDKDGHKIPVDISASITTVSGKKIIQSVFRDITERKQAEKEILELNDELEQKVVERTKELKDAQEKLLCKEKLAVLGQLSGRVGHELRNPLAAINNAAYYLNKVLPEADKKIKNHIGIISSEVNNAAKIISDLLDFSRTEPSDKEDTSINELITQVFKKHPPQSPKEVKTEINPDLPDVYIDPTG